ncbi:hypothetical protein OHB06_38025 [Streptomyces sp. NBC_01604]
MPFAELQVVGEVGGHDVQQAVGIAEEASRLQDVGDCGNGLVEGRRRRPVLPRRMPETADGCSICTPLARSCPRLTD